MSWQDFAYKDLAKNLTLSFHDLTCLIGGLCQELISKILAKMHAISYINLASQMGSLCQDLTSYT